MAFLRSGRGCLRRQRLVHQMCTRWVCQSGAAAGQAPPGTAAAKPNPSAATLQRCCTMLQPGHCDTLRAVACLLRVQMRAQNLTDLLAFSTCWEVDYQGSEQVRSVAQLRGSIRISIVQSALHVSMCLPCHAAFPPGSVARLSVCLLAILPVTRCQPCFHQASARVSCCRATPQPMQPPSSCLGCLRR